MPAGVNRTAAVRRPRDRAQTIGNDVLIFANPIAGRGLGAELARRLDLRLQSDGYHVRTSLARPSELTAAELNGQARAAIVIGGDGTLRSVAERLLSHGEPVPPLLPVPLGTANLMGRHLGIRWDEQKMEEQVSAAVRRRQVRPLDAARANGRLFLLMAGIGFDAHVVHELDRLRTGPINIASYVLPSVSAMRFYEFAPLVVMLDGHEVFPLAPALAFVGNLPEYGTGFPVLPHAKPDDGLLDLCVLPCASRLELVRWFALAAVGAHTTTPGAVYLKGKHVRIESPLSVPVQVDGDPGGHTPVEIELLRERLSFIVP